MRVSSHKELEFFNLMKNRRHRRLLFLATALLTAMAFFPAAPGFAQADPEHARRTADQWIETRRILSDEKAGWKEEKAFLDQSLTLMKKEISLLDEQIRNLRETTSASEEKRERLVTAKEGFTATAAEVEKTVGELEARVLQLALVFPPSLTNQVEPLFQRIPRDQSGSKPPLAQRVQSVIGILNEAAKFNGTITLDSELRELPDGGMTEVRTLYLGLAQAYFVNRSGRFAGIGVATATGWEWTPREDLAPAITRAIAIYENEQAADFISLPVRLSR